MKLLLDTHALLWWSLADRRLSLGACDAIGSEDTDVFVSAVVVWEIVIKAALGKLPIPADGFEKLRQVCRRAGFIELPVNVDHALAVRHLPLHHNDPFDRLLVPQAQVEGLTLCTDDREIRRYSVPTHC